MSEITKNPKNLSDQLYDLSMQTKNNKQLELEKRFEKLKDMIINLLIDEATKTGKMSLIINVEILIYKVINNVNTPQKHSIPTVKIESEEIWSYCQSLKAYFLKEGLIVKVREEDARFKIKWDRSKK